jgi:hypothetical protein
MQPLAEGRGRLAALSLPGRPTRLALTVALSISAGPKKAPSYLPFPSIFLYLRDGDGLLYLYRLRDVVEGKPKRVVIDLTHPLPTGAVARPQYPLAIVGLELDLAVPFVFQRRATLDVRSVAVAERGGWRPVAVGSGAKWRAYSTGFVLPLDAATARGTTQSAGSVTAVLGTGSFAINGVVFSRSPTAAFFLRPGTDSLPKAAPVLASDSFLAATNTRVGQVVPLSLSNGTHPVRITGSFHRFPTLDPATPSVVADLATYLGLSFALDNRVVEPSEWWLAAGDSAALAHRLRAAPFRSQDVVSRAEREHLLLEDAVPLGVIGALALGFAAAAAFAAVGFAASATAAVRQRTLEFAVLRSLGLRTRQLSGWVGLENALVVVFSLIGGTALGLLVSWLVLPYVALGASGATPVPPVELAVPWTTIVWLELALLLTLAVIGAAQLRLVRGLRLAPVLRSAEGTVAP